MLYFLSNTGTTVADPGCFIPDPDPSIFSSRIPKVFIPDPGLYCSVHKKRDEK
jgi:hypothetical protein